MKNIFTVTILSTALLMAACSNNDKADEQKQLNDVMNVHDKVMGYDENAMKNKILLDSLSKDARFTALKDSMQMMTQSLVAADNAMSIWMEKFNPDKTGKSHDQVITYFKGEQQKIMKIDTMFIRALQQSNGFIAKHGIK